MTTAIMAARRKNKAAAGRKGRQARPRQVRVRGQGAPGPKAHHRAGRHRLPRRRQPEQADFLANQLASLDKKDLHDLHLVMSCITLPAHIELFKKGMVRQVDFCFAGPQGTAVADLVKAKKFPVGAIHTYNELYARYYIDLTPRVALIAAAQADARATCFLAANTEETPAIVEPTAFSDGIVSPR